MGFSPCRSDRAHKMYFLCKTNPNVARPSWPCWHGRQARATLTGPPLWPRTANRAHKMYFLCKTNPMSSGAKMRLSSYHTWDYGAIGHLVNETSKPKQTQLWHGHLGRVGTGARPVTRLGILPYLAPGLPRFCLLGFHPGFATAVPVAPDPKRARAQNVLFMQNKPNCGTAILAVCS
jgi:hypothetical protein